MSKVKNRDRDLGENTRKVIRFLSNQKRDLTSIHLPLIREGVKRGLTSGTGAPC